MEKITSTAVQISGAHSQLQGPQTDRTFAISHALNPHPSDNINNIPIRERILRMGVAPVFRMTQYRDPRWYINPARYPKEKAPRKDRASIARNNGSNPIQATSPKGKGGSANTINPPDNSGNPQVYNLLGFEDDFPAFIGGSVDGFNDLHDFMSFFAGGLRWCIVANTLHEMFEFGFERLLIQLRRCKTLVGFYQHRFMTGDFS
jgi:hypothetical protein